MITKFGETLPELKQQFEGYLTMLLPQIMEASEYAQGASPTDDQLAEHSNTLSGFLARVNALYGEMEGFQQQFTALATELVFNANPEMGATLAKALAGKHTAQCNQVYKTVDRLSATLTHQLTNLNARIWLYREELKAVNSNRGTEGTRR